MCPTSPESSYVMSLHIWGRDESEVCPECVMFLGLFLAHDAFCTFVKYALYKSFGKCFCIYVPGIYLRCTQGVS